MSEVQAGHGRPASPVETSTVPELDDARDTTGAIVRASAVVREVTELAHAIEELRASNARYAAVLESALDCIITIDHEGRILEFNPAAERTFGHSRDEVLGEKMVDLIIPPSLRARHRAGFAHYLATGEGPILGQRLELTAMRADGSEFPIELAVVRATQSGTPLFTGYLRDITERREAEAERLALQHRLGQSQRLESLGQLAGGIAHDFNNLLGVILNYANFVAEELHDNDAARADVEQIRAAAERAVRLTRQLLIFGRRGTVQPEVLDLNAIVREIHHLLARTLGEHIELVVDTAESLPAIRADRGQIEQVVVNLAVNARDAMRGGGKLGVETAVVDLDDGYSGLHPEVPPGRYVRLTMADTGTGMSPDVIAHAFEPFFTTKQPGEGTGLGLATVYGIVVGVGGAINLYSEAGIGTTVRIYLPAIDEPAPTVTGPTASSAPAGNGETILVVEDEPALRAVMQRILSRRGYHVLTAGSGPEALTIARRHEAEIPLLITDVIMPQMLGQEVADGARAIHPRLRVLFVSGYAHALLSASGNLDPEVVLLEKPFSEGALLRRVRELLAPVAPECPENATRE